MLQYTSTITLIPGRTTVSRNVIHDGFRYCLNKKPDEKTYWRCTDKTFCGRFNLVNETTVTSTKPHSHPPTPAENSVFKAKQGLKRKASDTDLPTQTQTPYIGITPSYPSPQLGCPGPFCSIGDKKI